jgi:tetratricopeptide (TPR) repeat protein
MAYADDPPAPVLEDKTASPIDQEKTADTDQKVAEKVDEAPQAEDSAPDPNAGLADLDQAAQLKVTAENLPDLNGVVDKLDSAIEKGLDEENRTFANEILISALLQRATMLSAAVLERPLADPRRDPRWMQVRQFALNDLQRVISLDEKIWEAHLLMGRLHALPLGDPGAARRELTLVIDAPDADTADRAQALVLRGTLQTDETKRVHDFDAAIALMPDKPDYYRVRAQYLYGQDKFKEALVDVDEAIRLEPDHAATQELRGLILLGLDRYDDALATFNKASELEPKAVLPYQHRGEVYRQQGDLKKSAEQLSKALEIVPGDAATLLLRANVLYQLKDYEGALKDVETVIKAQPQLLVAYLLQAEIYASTNRIDQAIQVLEKLVPLAPNQPRLLEPLATYYLIGGQPRKSIETFSSVLKLEPEDYRALRFRGDANLNIGNHAAAVADFAAAVKLNADDEGLLNNYAWVLATSPDDKVRDGKRAIELATEAAELTTYTVPHILSTLAASYAETGDFETAKKWSKKAVELGENDADREQLGKELASYEAGKPWREAQQQEEKPASPSAGDHTFAPPSVKPAPARTLDF